MVVSSWMSNRAPIVLLNDVSNTERHELIVEVLLENDATHLEISYCGLLAVRLTNRQACLSGHNRTAD